jgi:acetyl esterase/lipase
LKELGAFLAAKNSPALQNGADKNVVAADLRTGLLLLHGMVDDNVHPANTMQMAKALQDADIPFEMLIFPTSDHGIHAPMYRSAKWSFLLRRLGVLDVAAPRTVAPEAAKP